MGSYTMELARHTGYMTASDIDFHYCIIILRFTHAKRVYFHFHFYFNFKPYNENKEISQSIKT